MYNIYKHFLEDSEEHVDLPYQHRILNVGIENNKIFLTVQSNDNNGTTSSWIRCRPSNNSWFPSTDEFYIGTVEATPFSFNVFVEYLESYEIIHTPEETQNSVKVENLRNTVNEYTHKFDNLKYEPAITNLEAKVYTLNNEFMTLTKSLDTKFFTLVDSLTGYKLTRLSEIFTPEGILSLIIVGEK